MKFVLVIYNDAALYDALPRTETDQMMRGCLAHADELRRDGRLTDSQMLEGAETAKSVRIRNGRTKVTDGPFTEAKEVLGGFNLIEANRCATSRRCGGECIGSPYGGATSPPRSGSRLCSSCGFPNVQLTLNSSPRIARRRSDTW